MRNAFLMFVCIVITSCSTGINEQRVEQDFRRVVSVDYKNIDVKKIQRVAIGDGWDDGFEVRVYFEGSCKPEMAASSSKTECPQGALHMQMSYQKSADGEWGILATKIVGEQGHKVRIPIVY